MNTEKLIVLKEIKSIIKEKLAKFEAVIQRCLKMIDFAPITPIYEHFSYLWRFVKEFESKNAEDFETKFWKTMRIALYS